MLKHELKQYFDQSVHFVGVNELFSCLLLYLLPKVVEWLREAWTEDRVIVKIAYEVQRKLLVLWCFM